MYSARPGLLIGFHGCETELRNDVIAGNRALNASKNTHDWLGNGIYFWENNYERALDFAMNPPGKTKEVKNPSTPFAASSSKEMSSTREPGSTIKIISRSASAIPIA
jgi:hypothetical protein